MNVTGFSDDNDSSVVANRSDVNFDDSITHAIKVYIVIGYVALALGIPGNILSAIVWLRGPVVSKNSSSVYLAALAIVDLVRPLFVRILETYNCLGGLFCTSCWTMASIAGILEPLLVLSFSVERLIAIRHPFQVCYLHRRVGQKLDYFNKFMTPVLLTYAQDYAALSPLHTRQIDQVRHFSVCSAPRPVYSCFIAAATRS